MHTKHTEWIRVSATILGQFLIIIVASYLAFHSEIIQQVLHSAGSQRILKIAGCLMLALILAISSWRYSQLMRLIVMICLTTMIFGNVAMWPLGPKSMVLFPMRITGHPSLFAATEKHYPRDMPDSRLHFLFRSTLRGKDLILPDGPWANLITEKELAQYSPWSTIIRKKYDPILDDSQYQKWSQSFDSKPITIGHKILGDVEIVLNFDPLGQIAENAVKLYISPSLKTAILTPIHNTSNQIGSSRD